MSIATGLPVAVNYAIKMQIGSLPPTWALFDIKGRAVRQVLDGFSADPSKTRFIFKETEYDALGRRTQISIPHEANVPPRWNVNEYDDLGRVCASTAINGLRTETLFLGRPTGGGYVITVVDPKQQLSGPPRMAIRNRPSLADMRFQRRVIGFMAESKDFFDRQHAQANDRVVGHSWEEHIRI